MLGIEPSPKGKMRNGLQAFPKLTKELLLSNEHAVLQQQHCCRRNETDAILQKTAR